jgi:hypothetical protein
LLTPADLPGNYSVNPVTGSGLGGSMLSGCPPLTTNPAGLIGQAVVSLVGSANDPTVSEAVLQLSPGDVTQAMAGFTAMPTSCSTFTGVVDNYNVAFGTAPLAITPLGDQSTAVRITGHIMGGLASVYADVVVIRHASTLVLVMDVGLTADTAFTEQIASEAYARVAARW